ncbi:MAG TPA: hypothetical protein VM711_01095 [Sphingomicrobium sp.]|nr:hypothetical protein [Sphingomicrobium sp.]
MQLSKFVLILVFGVGLAGCFTSYDPLIAANASDHPLAVGARFTDALNCASVSFGCDSRNGYRPISSGSIEMERGQYVLHFDPGSNLALSLPAAQGANKPGLLFKSIGRGLYVTQLDGGPQDATGGDGAPPRYLYALVRMQGDYLYIYKYMCEENGDVKYVKSGLLKSITSSFGMAICQPSDLRGLAEVFRDRLANGLAPSERLELKAGKSSGH